MQDFDDIILWVVMALSLFMILWILILYTGGCHVGLNLHLESKPSVTSTP